LCLAQGNLSVPAVDTGNVNITVMSTSPFNETWKVSNDGNAFTLAPCSNPVPTRDQISAVYQYITQFGYARKGLTDVIIVTAPKVTHTSIDVDV
jgi:hypothetical protein